MFRHQRHFGPVPASRPLSQAVVPLKRLSAIASTEEIGLQDIELGSDGKNQGNGQTVHISRLQSGQIVVGVHSIRSRDRELRVDGASLVQIGHEDHQTVRISRRAQSSGGRSQNAVSQSTRLGLIFQGKQKHERDESRRMTRYNPRTKFTHKMVPESSRSKRQESG